MPKRKSFYQDERPEARQAQLRAHEELLERGLAGKQGRPLDIPIERIRPNPFQARRNFEGLEELVESIRAQGFTTRLRVRPDPSQEGYFQLVYGERRLRAAREAGLAVVPCEVAPHTDEELIEIGLAENIQRQDLAPLEEAQAFRLFIDQRGYSLRSLAERIGKDKGYIENRLRLLEAPADVQAMLAQRVDTISVARDLVRLATPEERRPLIEGVISGALSAQDVRALVRDALSPAPEPASPFLPIRPSEEPAGPRGGAPHREPGGAASRDVGPASARRVVERDLRAMLTILERWRGLLGQHEGRAAARQGLAQLRAELDRLEGEL
jgi:ParB family transcriptional regulator, chromosome partitioning protein